MTLIRAFVLTLLLVAQPWAGLGALAATVRIIAAGDAAVVICTGAGVRLVRTDGDGDAVQGDILVCPSVAALLLDGAVQPSAPMPPWRPAGRIAHVVHADQATQSVFDAPRARAPPPFRESRKQDV